MAARSFPDDDRTPGNSRTQAEEQVQTWGRMRRIRLRKKDAKDEKRKKFARTVSNFTGSSKGCRRLSQ